MHYSGVIVQDKSKYFSGTRPVIALSEPVIDPNGYESIYVVLSYGLECVLGDDNWNIFLTDVEGKPNWYGIRRYDDSDYEDKLYSLKEFLEVFDE